MRHSGNPQTLANHKYDRDTPNCDPSRTGRKDLVSRGEAFSPLRKFDAPSSGSSSSGDAATGRAAVIRASGSVAPPSGALAQSDETAKMGAGLPIGAPSARDRPDMKQANAVRLQQRVGEGKLPAGPLRKSNGEASRADHLPLLPLSIDPPRHSGNDLPRGRCVRAAGPGVRPPGSADCRGLQRRRTISSAPRHSDVAALRGRSAGANPGGLSPWTKEGSFDCGDEFAKARTGRHQNLLPPGAAHESTALCHGSTAQGPNGNRLKAVGALARSTGTAAVSNGSISRCQSAPFLRPAGDLQSATPSVGAELSHSYHGTTLDARNRQAISAIHGRDARLAAAATVAAAASNKTRASSRAAAGGRLLQRPPAPPTRGGSHPSGHGKQPVDGAAQRNPHLLLCRPSEPQQQAQPPQWKPQLASGRERSPPGMANRSPSAHKPPMQSFQCPHCSSSSMQLSISPSKKYVPVPSDRSEDLRIARTASSPGSILLAASASAAGAPLPRRIASRAEYIALRRGFSVLIDSTSATLRTRLETIRALYDQVARAAGLDVPLENEKELPRSVADETAAHHEGPLAPLPLTVLQRCEENHWHRRAPPDACRLLAGTAGGPAARPPGERTLGKEISGGGQVAEVVAPGGLRRSDGSGGLEIIHPLSKRVKAPAHLVSTSLADLSVLEGPVSSFNAGGSFASMSRASCSLPFPPSMKESPVDPRRLSEATGASPVSRSDVGFVPAGLGRVVASSHRDGGASGDGGGARHPLVKAGATSSSRSARPAASSGAPPCPAAAPRPPVNKVEKTDRSLQLRLAAHQGGERPLPSNDASDSHGISQTPSALNTSQRRKRHGSYPTPTHPTAQTRPLGGLPRGHFDRARRLGVDPSACARHRGKSFDPERFHRWICWLSMRKWSKISSRKKREMTTLRKMKEVLMMKSCSTTKVGTEMR
eukprot:GHVT01019020.1.p1 GENE.GHVT01019020.1~~GHVT01019020.1.p1  ORF type:complete len:938 (-),score=193.84 GHVT01019020.1:428-3241(-)